MKEGANTIATYTYNGLGQRVKKAAGEITTVYHYDLDGKLIAESTSTGTFTKEYLYMGAVRVAMVEIGPGGSSIYHYLNDRLGTPEVLTDASGTVAWEAWYEPFGEAHVHPSSSVVNNIRLPGQYFDAETGFHYNYHRYYDPRTGRYLTPDPVGQLAGLNLYRYTFNNPVNRTDPYGLLVDAGVITIPVAVIALGKAAVFVGSAIGVATLVDRVFLNEKESDKGEVCEEPAQGEQNTNPFVGPVDEPVIVVDPQGNAIPVNKGKHIETSPDGKWLDVKDQDNRSTGVQIHGPHKEKTHGAHPEGMVPHAHLTGDPGGKHWFPIR